MTDKKRTLVIDIIDSMSMRPHVDATIDYLRKERKLSTAECYYLVRHLYKSFPVEMLPKGLVEAMDEAERMEDDE